jgi:hypothetical protein
LVIGLVLAAVIAVTVVRGWETLPEPELESELVAMWLILILRLARSQWSPRVLMYLRSQSTVPLQRVRVGRLALLFSVWQLEQAAVAVAEVWASSSSLLSLAMVQIA